MRLSLAAIALLASSLLAGCGGDDDRAVTPAPTRDANGVSLVECTEMPDDDVAGPYEADEVGWARDRADQVAEALGADVRFCIDPSGSLHYFAKLDGDITAKGKAFLRRTCRPASSALGSEPGTVHLVFDDEQHVCA